MRKNFLRFFVAFLLLFTLLALEAVFAVNILWTEAQPAGNTNRNWNALASDSTGQHLMAGVSIGGLYVSSDSGVTWQETRPAGDAKKYWYALASNSDGSRLIAGAYYGRLYSFNSATGLWTQLKPAGTVDKNWSVAASDSSGAHLAAAVYGGRLYTSADFGVTWQETRPAGNANKNWTSLALSSDGSRIIAGVKGGRLYTSADFGVTWQETRPAGNANKNWNVAASDSTGQHLAAAVYGGRLYISNDFGSTWQETRPAGNANKNWSAISMDSFAENFIACVYGGRLYASSDSAATWVERWPAGAVNKNWSSVALNSSGSRFLAGVYAGRLYNGAVSLTEPSTNEPMISIVEGNISTGKTVRVLGSGFKTVKGSIVIADSANLGASAVKITQTVSQWSDNMVLFTVKTGTFENGSQVYLFLTKSTGEYNTTGFPITIGAGHADTNPPVIVSTLPQSGAVRVAVNTSIRVELSDSDPGINKSSIVLYVSGTKVTPTISQSGQNVLLDYTPAAAFAGFKTIIVRVVVSDLDANKLDTSFSFKTAARLAYPNVAWDVASLTPAYQISDVDNAKTIRILVQGRYLAFSASKIALEFTGRNSDNYRIKNVSIAEADLSADPSVQSVVPGTWTRVLFDNQKASNWQNSYVTVPAGGVKVSQSLSFPINPAKSYYITFKNEAKSADQTAYSDSVATHYLQDYSLNQNLTGGTAGSLLNLSRIYAVVAGSTSYRLSVSAENGSVSLSKPGPFYPAGDQLTLTASPNAGYLFDHWSGDEAGTSNPLDITMSSDKSIVANFVAEEPATPLPPGTYTLTITPISGASVGSSFTSNYAAGAVVTLSAIPTTGYLFDHWSGDLAGNANPVNITMDRNKSVIGNFVAIPPQSLVNFKNAVASFFTNVANFFRRIFNFKF